MSTERHAYAVIACDWPDCGAQVIGEDDASAHDVRADARALGWRRGRDMQDAYIDLCPTHYAEHRSQCVAERREKRAAAMRAAQQRRQERQRLAEEHARYWERRKAQLQEERAQERRIAEARRALLETWGTEDGAHDQARAAYWAAVAEEDGSAADRIAIPLDAAITAYRLARTTNDGAGLRQAAAAITHALRSTYTAQFYTFVELREDHPKGPTIIATDGERLFACAAPAG